jgi:hypothetical protein
MPLLPGDSVTISVSPSIELAKYQFLKPHVSLTRVIGEDPQQTIADMEKEVRQLALKAAAVELSLDDELISALRAGDLHNYIKGAIENEQITEKHTQQLQDTGVPARDATKATRLVRKALKA